MWRASSSTGEVDWRLPFDRLTEAPDFDGGLMGFAERVLQGLAAFGFAMDQPGLFLAPGEALVITQEFAVISVAREGIERLDAGPDADAFAEYVDLAESFPQFPSQRLFCAIPDKKHGCAGIIQIVFQMVEHPTGLAHARGRNDDGRFFQRVRDRAAGRRRHDRCRPKKEIVGLIRFLSRPE